MGEKRKRDSKITELRVSALTEEPSVVVGSFFNGLSIPKETDFNLYKAKKSNDFLIHGENDRLDYNGNTGEAETNDYCVAVYDPVNKSVELYQSPMVLGKVIAKSKKTYKGPSVKQTDVRFAVQRNALGEAFGTKKAKKAISDLERNRIDAEKLQGNELDIIDSVKTLTKDLPSRVQLAETVSNDRPTPACNVDATNVEDVYSLENIIPSKEFAFLRVGSILKEEDTKARLEMLPYSKSFYISNHLPQITSSAQTEKLQLLYYASLLFGVYENRRVSKKAELIEKLKEPAEILIDGILDRFAISRPGHFGRAKERGYVIDPQHEDKLLCYLLALILHIDGFMVEIPPLAQELSMKPSRLVGLFKALGCVIKSASVAQAEAFGIAKSAASTYKIASLKVPFKLPEMVSRGARKGR